MGTGRALKAVTRCGNELDIFLTLTELKHDSFQGFCGFIKYLGGKPEDTTILDEAIVQSSPSPTVSADSLPEMAHANMSNQSMNDDEHRVHSGAGSTSTFTARDSFSSQSTAHTAASPPRALLSSDEVSTMSSPSDERDTFELSPDTHDNNGDDEEIVDMPTPPRLHRQMSQFARSQLARSQAHHSHSDHTSKGSSHSSGSGRVSGEHLSSVSSGIATKRQRHASVVGTHYNEPFIDTGSNYEVLHPDTTDADNAQLSSSSSTDEEEGERDAQYRVIAFNELLLESKPIGKGAFGVVFKARWRGSLVAVKQFMMYFDKRQRREFHREANMLAKVANHRNIVRFVGACTQPFCLVTDFCERGSVYDLVIKHKQQISLKLILSILRDAACGVWHLHQEDVIHRDIAARNVLLTKDFVAQVTDFGLSRLRGNEEDRSYDTTLSSLGPIRYMAPESLAEKKYSPATDSYMFGILIWEITHGQVPYTNTPLQPFDVARAVISGEMRPIIDHRRCDDELLTQLMKTCWSGDPHQRPSILRMYDELQQHPLLNDR
eukprot:CAMPEP_0168584814 /NCGR_PEP_ID=MMETSP0420-20121227/3345_1 /TAXON_ID=498008 /ORGANISM="Pessonella sp." /LENGTH=547 /DNA_ID=CAMNT_0008619651 /DNA_START=159 /DNA_END=1802 /DNA_ORIENTATION=-